MSLFVFLVIIVTLSLLYEKGKANTGELSLEEKKILLNGVSRSVVKEMTSSIKDKVDLKLELNPADDDSEELGHVGLSLSVEAYYGVSRWKGCASASLEGIKKFTVEATSLFDRSYLQALPKELENSVNVKSPLLFNDLELNLNRAVYAKDKTLMPSTHKYINKQVMIIKTVGVILVFSYPQHSQSGPPSPMCEVRMMKYDGYDKIIIPFNPGVEEPTWSFLKAMVQKHYYTMSQFLRIVSESVKSAVEQDGRCTYKGVVQDAESESKSESDSKHSLYEKLCVKRQFEPLANEIVNSVVEKVRSSMRNKIDVGWLEYSDSDAYMCATDVSIKGVETFTIDKPSFDIKEEEVVVDFPLVLKDLQLNLNRIAKNDRKGYYNEVYFPLVHYNFNKKAKISEIETVFISISYKKNFKKSQNNGDPSLECKIGLDLSKAKITTGDDQIYGGKKWDYLSTTLRSDTRLKAALVKTVKSAVDSDKRCTYGGYVDEMDLNDNQKASYKSLTFEKAEPLSDKFTELCVKHVTNPQVVEIINSVREKLKSKIKDEVDVQKLGLELENINSYLCAKKTYIKGIIKLPTNAVQLNLDDNKDNEEETVLRIPLVFEDLQVTLNEMAVKKYKNIKSHKSTSYYVSKQLKLTVNDDGLYLKMSYKKDVTNSQIGSPSIKDCKISLEIPSQDIGKKSSSFVPVRTEPGLGYIYNLLSEETKAISTPFFKILTEYVVEAVAEDGQCTYNKGEANPENSNQPAKTTGSKRFEMCKNKIEKDRVAPEAGLLDWGLHHIRNIF